MSEGLVVVVSTRPFEDTLNALVASVKHRQVEVFGIVDHAVNAQGAGLTLGRGFARQIKETTCDPIMQLSCFPQKL